MTKIIGLTGGIASGKSTVSNLLKAAGFPIVDADLIARQVQQPGSTGLDRLAAAFGAQIIGPDGQLDRSQLGRQVFGDDQARRRLDAIMQPLIRDAIWDSVDSLKRAGAPAVILDVPLLFEQHYDQDCDYVVVVAVDPATELQRLMARNHYSKEAASARIAAQMPLKEKIRRADRVIDNNGSLEETRRQVAQLVEDLRHPR